MNEELIEIFKRNTRIAKTVGHAVAWFNGTEIRTVCDRRGRLLWRINNRPVSRFDALAYFA